MATVSQVRRHATPKERALWAEMAQVLMLDGLAGANNWEAKDIVFHGGTSIHLGWSSPRHSEDLDFLVKKDLLSEMEKTMEKVVDAMRRRIIHLDPDLIVEIKNKSNPRMGRFNISISKQNVMGKSMVKSEFWGVESTYLDSYNAVRKIPKISSSLQEEGVYVKIRSSLPMATLDSVYCDKIVAMAGRPHLKWRDAFDLWWISQSREFEKPEPAVLARRVLHYASAYRNDPNSEDDDSIDKVMGSSTTDVTDRSVSTFASRLRSYAARVSTPEMIEASHTDLKRFLTSISGSTRVWDMYWPDGVHEMVEYAANTALEMADLIDQVQSEVNKQNHLDVSNGSDEDAPVAKDRTRPTF